MKGPISTQGLASTMMDTCYQPFLHRQKPAGTDLASHNNIPHPPSSHTRARFSIHTTTLQAFLRQLSNGKSGHWFESPYSRNLARIYDGNIGGLSRRNSNIFRLEALSSVLDMTHRCITYALIHTDLLISDSVN
jgi:hypothetical protein